MYADQQSKASNYVGHHPRGEVKLNSPLDTAMNRLGAAIDELGAASDVLVSRLCPLLAPSPPSTDRSGNVTSVANGSDHVQRINDQTERVMRYVAQLQDAATRLEV